MEVADAELLAKDINEGDWVFFDKDNEIFKEQQRKWFWRIIDEIYNQQQKSFISC